MNKSKLTLILLCLGYFIDFYDLSIMGVSYNEILKTQFNLYDLTKIQNTYLLISNFQTLGIFIGCLIFGYLGDKLGRAAAIKFSILIYSISTLLCIYTTSLPIFISLRMIAYIGLATEFASSTVLISELFNTKDSAFGSAILYSCGVLGGICASFIGIFSYQTMFILGGLSGLIIYITRAKLHESMVYLNARENTNIQFGQIWQLITKPTYFIQLIRYTLMILPFNAIITTMFILPNYIVTSFSVAYATKILLIGFFIGNIISSLTSAFFNKLILQKYFMLACLILFLGLMFSFTHVPQSYLLLFSIALGLCGGGYPIIWALQIARIFPIEIRASSMNLLYALGRASSLIFNLLIANWLLHHSFINNAMLTALIVGLLAIFSIVIGRPVYLEVCHEKI